MKPRKPIRRVSKKRAKELREYMKLRAEFLSMYVTCQICGLQFATDIHHSMGRTGSLLNKQIFWTAVCRECHQKCHNHPVWSRLHGFSKDRLSHE